jgi:2-dehydropantoate 2-reductase
VKIAVFGAGAIGASAGAMLARAGHDVSLIGRGDHFAAMRENGVRIVQRAGETVARPACPGSLAEAGPQDLVIVATKAHSVGEAAEAIQPMLGPDTPVICAQNGVPWWYFDGIGGEWEGRVLRSVDADGRARELIGTARCIGAVVTGAANVTAPGVIQLSNLRFMVGEPFEGVSPRLDALARAIDVEGLSAAAHARLRDDVWFKLLGNISFSMMSVLAFADLRVVRNDPGTRAISRKVMEETQAVGEAVGASFDRTIDERMEESRRMAAHRPSTLQDLERGRPMEVDAICGAVAEIGRMAGVITPVIDMVYALVRLRAIEAGCYPANPGFELFPDDETT